MGSPVEHPMMCTRGCCVGRDDIDYQASETTVDHAPGWGASAVLVAVNRRIRESEFGDAKRAQDAEAWYRCECVARLDFSCNAENVVPERDHERAKRSSRFPRSVRATCTRSFSWS